MRNKLLYSILPVLAVLAVSLCLTACGSKEFGDADVRGVDAVYSGTILDVTPVLVREDPSKVGPLIGAGVGGLVGSAFGGGTGRLLFTLGGAALGAEYGGLSLSGYRSYKAQQLTIQLDSGTHVVIVTGLDEYFVRGDKVRIVRMDKERALVQHQ